MFSTKEIEYSSLKNGFFPPVFHHSAEKKFPHIVLLSLTLELAGHRGRNFKITLSRLKKGNGL